MSRYTGYNQTGFANSTVAVTRAAVGTTTPINQANTAGAIGGNEIYGAFDTTTTVLNSTTYVAGNTAINRTTKKLNKDITDKRLNEAELFGILFLNPFIASFYHKYSRNNN